MNSLSNLSVYTLFSGSRGNSIYIKAGNTEFLIDAGLSVKSINTALTAVGAEIKNIKNIFVTHEHTDHVAAIKNFTHNHDVAVHAVEQSSHLIGCDPTRLNVYSRIYSVSLNDAEISSFVTPHDSKASVGYIIRTDYGVVGIATDLGYIPDDIYDTLSYCDYLIIESNHDVDMLMNGPYPAHLKQRILSQNGHLSNIGCAQAVASLAGCGVKKFLLAHLSEHNNTSALALMTTQSELERRGYHNVSVKIADTYTPTRLI